MPGRVPAPTEPLESWERCPGAASSPLGRYRRREPEKTLLHEVVRERLEPFLAAARERSAHGRGLPAFVERELRAYLDCGILARGFARVRCPDCGFERLVAFSCKTHVCPCTWWRARARFRTTPSSSTRSPPTPVCGRPSSTRTRPGTTSSSATGWSRSRRDSPGGCGWCTRSRARSIRSATGQTCTRAG